MHDMEYLINVQYKAKKQLFILQKTEQTALIYCAQSGDVELVNLLLKRKADVHKTDKVDNIILVYNNYLVILVGLNDNYFRILT